MKHLTLTCDTLNVASRRVIEKNGGVLVDTYPEEGRMTQRFHVAL
jgi:predicted acetyltransferase